MQTPICLTEQAKEHLQQQADIILQKKSHVKIGCITIYLYHAMNKGYVILQS